MSGFGLPVRKQLFDLHARDFEIERIRTQINFTRPFQGATVMDHFYFGKMIHIIPRRKHALANLCRQIYNAFHAVIKTEFQSVARQRLDGGDVFHGANMT